MEHGLYIEEFVCNLGDEQLANHYDTDNGPEALTHLQFEYTFTSLEATGIEHIPEVCPDEYREQECCLVRSHLGSNTDCSVEHLRNGRYHGMVEKPIESKGDGKEDKAYTA